ncbi:RNA export factor gle2, partial [Spiromyces aspiralis]
ANNQCVPYASHNHGKPVLTTCWSPDSKFLFSGGADNLVYMMDVDTKQTKVVAKHDQPIQAVRIVMTGSEPVLATGSWDKTIKFWDLKQEAPVHSIDLPERCYAMDSRGSILVAALAELQYFCFDTNSPQTPRTTKSQNSYQLTSVAIFHDGTGYVGGSIEGRAEIQVFNPTSDKDCFAYRCHRSNGQTFPINQVRVNPSTGTFITAGGDGEMIVWDKDSKSRTGSFASEPKAPVTACAYTSDGNRVAYATGEDWSKGVRNVEKTLTGRIMIRNLTPTLRDPKKA